jgi:RNase adapter protein RapZ
VAIGCTGGQHRSVYIAQALAARFGVQSNVIVRHRDAPIPVDESAIHTRT